MLITKNTKLIKINYKKQIKIRIIEIVVTKIINLREINNCLTKKKDF